MGLAGDQEHVDEVLRVVHVLDGFVESIHHQQCVVLQRGVVAQVLNRSELLEHRFDVCSTLEHSVSSGSVSGGIVNFSYFVVAVFDIFNCFFFVFYFRLQSFSNYF